ncbi:MAG TPA: hypothetical protein VNZ26_10565 [Vicinamibacterales bacterium]|jgi:hypothetical protein|nr:hypothetical protein [Vicinamibacterales bacterium]
MSIEQSEFDALRATIRERGTARIWLFFAGVTSWAAVSLGAAALSLPPVGTVLPLLILAAAFEGVYALHVGVERIGRYLQARAEGSNTVSRNVTWETTIMAFGRPKGSARVDALFSTIFIIAGICNVIPALGVLVGGATPAELVFVGGVHALFIARVLYARSVAARQRDIDLARFKELSNVD